MGPRIAYAQQKIPGAPKADLNYGQARLVASVGEPIIYDVEMNAPRVNRPENRGAVDLMTSQRRAPSAAHCGELDTAAFVSISDTTLALRLALD